RKPPPKILEMRRIVYDNDHAAEDLRGELRDRWAADPGAAWSGVDPHGFQATPNSNGPSWLRYRHVLRTSPDPHQPELITDFMGYNTYEPHRNVPPQPNWVGDLLVECEVAVEQPNGTFTLELSKGVDRFRARWDLATGKCTLLRLKEPHPGSDVVRHPPADDHYIELADKPTKLQGKGKHHVRFANIDDRLLVWVDDELPFGDGVNYQPFPEKGPYTNDLQPASIGVQGASLQVRKLSLWRDTYYTRNPSAGADATLDRREDWSNPEAWDPLRQIKPTTLYVQPGHYLCLGDNSPESSDGRSWGLVPERLVLGRALVVYYPFSRAGRIK
ncbi:MAG TPA: S26 family signal peptidase, partial [Gemmataceae bacterium]|nr:S26 family signal peptidase [Gemmataceae bacterium]